MQNKQDKITLYNVTFNLDDKSTLLRPAIPESAADDEDKATLRVCFTDSVEHCMQAIASENRDVRNGRQFLLREFQIDTTDPFLVYPETLKQQGKVPDALENHEYWYLKSAFVQVKLCKIIRFDYSYELAWSCISLEQCKQVIAKYTNVFSNQQCISAESLYKAFCSWANENRQWNAMDSVWDDLAMLPWAQKIEIRKIVYEELSNVIASFVVGGLYTTSDWTLGGILIYVVKERDNDRVRLEERSSNVDGCFRQDVGWFDVYTDGDMEYVVLGEYHGNEHRLYVDESGHSMREVRSFG